MLEIMKTESTLTAIKDKAIRNHIEAAYSATLDIDKSAIKIAYHVHCIKPLLEGNTDGLPTDFTKFCETRLGIKKAQAYNLDAIGARISMVLIDDKPPIYIDSFTQTAIYNKCFDKESNRVNWDMYYKKLKSAKTLGSTQVLTILRNQVKREIEFDDIVELIDKGTLHSGLKIKEIDSLLSGKFALTEKAKKPAEESKTEESKTEESKTEESKTEESKTEESKIITKVAISVIISMYEGKGFSQLAPYEQFCFCKYIAIQANTLDDKAKSTDFEQKAQSLKKLLDEIIE